MGGSVGGPPRRVQATGLLPKAPPLPQGFGQTTEAPPPHAAGAVACHKKGAARCRVDVAAARRAHFAGTPPWVP